MFTPKPALLLAATVSIWMARTAFAQSNDFTPTGKGAGTLQASGPKNASPVGPHQAGVEGGQHGINYHGGPVLTGTKNVYYIWYGNWAGNTATSILPTLASNLNGSPYFNINATYRQSQSLGGGNVSNSVALAGSVFDPYSHGSSLTFADVIDIVAAQNPTDPNGVYFVLTSADVSDTGGFCSLYCAYHGHSSLNGLDVKFAFVGNPERCPSSCIATENQTSSPNNNPGADGMANFIAHELSEVAVDPDLNAWYDHAGEENADKCEWKFGTVFSAGGASVANVTLGGLNFLLQQNWVNAQAGFCALSN